MCTVSFLPLKDGFILTSNRDETLERQANFPVSYSSKSGEITFPQDPKAGGTWIAGNGQKMICLLNGAFKKHKHNPPYKHSRGKVILDAFDAESFQDFTEHYDFSGLEPHTLIMVDFTTEPELVELKWDGNTKHINKKSSSETHIWSSCTLYSPEVISQRENWFNDWVKSNDFDHVGIKKFHKTGGSGDSKNDLLMERSEKLKTISITSFVSSKNDTIISHEDLLKNKLKTVSLESKEKTHG